jgi:hypothetical protein
MPDLNFRVTGVEPAERGLVPLLQFQLEVTNTPASELIQSAMVQAQIQFQCPQRAYRNGEKEKLVELFGTPDFWGQTLRNRLWAHAATTLRSFSEKTTAVLPVPCTFDLNVSAAKYFYALEDGDVPLLFLFSGTVFYSGPDGRLQAQQISWDKECAWRMPVSVWRGLMDHHWPNSAWLPVHRDVFDRLYEFKRRNGFSTWEQTLERLLADSPETRDAEAIPALQP